MGYDITSPANERIKWLIRLRDRRARDAEGVFLVEGERLYRRALETGMTPTASFIADEAIATKGDTVTVAPEALAKASYRSRSEGIIAVFDQPDTDLDRLSPGPDPLMLVAENVEKPGNLGAMARSAAAAGAEALITIGDTVDPWNPNALRSSTGAVLSLPLARSSWDRLTPWLAERGIRVVATSPRGASSLWESDLTGPLALVIGAEDQGLSGQAEMAADEIAVIPMASPGVDSLNASVAAAIVMFEAVRQRS